MKSVAQHYFLEVKKKKTHILRIGEGKQKLVFLHGWGGSTDSFFQLCLNLEKKLKDFEFILIDFPGFGKTQMPDKKGWDTFEYADWTYELLEKVFLEAKKNNFKNINFYTHSFGGRVLTRLLVKHTQNFGKIILTGSAGVKWPLTAKQKVSMKLGKVFKPFNKICPKKIKRIIVSKVFGARDWDAVSDDLKPTLQKTVEEKDFREDLKKIQNEALILWGEKDSITPLKSGKIFAKNLAHNKFLTFKTGKHGIHYTHKDKIIQEIIKFLG